MILIEDVRQWVFKVKVRKECQQNTADNKQWESNI
jgi:hypothetical protein